MYGSVAAAEWWTVMGRRAYPAATDPYITADAGGSNGYRSRAWKAGPSAGSSAISPRTGEGAAS
jgi:hypothetical protein